MNKQYISRQLAACVALFVALAAFGGNAKEVYIPMDYSACGYHASEKPIPNVANAVYVPAVEGDNYERLQRAIDYVSALKPDVFGHRGAVLLGEGVYHIDQPLRIATGGVVIRGAGREQTVIVKRGVDRGAQIYIKGTRTMTGGDTIAVTDKLVRAAATSVVLESVKGLAVGDRLRLVRPSTKEWIASLGCDDFGGGLDFTGWKPGEIDITWDRTITAIDGNRIIIDAPITATISEEWGGAYVVTGYNEGEITECGVENLSLKSDYNDWNPNDEDHCWNGIWIDNARDCWVRRVDFAHFAGSAVSVQRGASRVTVESCVAHDPVSELGGWRRSVFFTLGQQTLFQLCVSRDGYHDFAAGFCAAGPNAFVQCEGENAHGFSGAIGSWATGLLFDIVNIDRNDLAFRNLEQYQMGTGWNTANSMFWQCTASSIYCYSPDDDNRNSANGCWGMLWGNGEWTSSNDHVQPRSLFYYQLKRRMGKKLSVNKRVLPDSVLLSIREAEVDMYLLPRDVVASSSPTVEAAEAMAQRSLTEPRLTLEMWIDTINYTASTSPKNVKSIDNIKALSTAKNSSTAAYTYGVQNGHIVQLDAAKSKAQGRLVTGNRYHIPWWNGRTKDLYLNTSARPAITRFVPGREGNGLTDHIDEVVDYLADNGYCLLDHNYGLWYDLRRIDHERISRADGDVWAPFYEQPFARTGIGTGWDGLSLYDLTKPNLWYWSRLKEYADKGAQRGQLLFHQNYFQHNILEAGAHWVDCPWRPVNNVNSTTFPEPVPFTGDKRVFMAEQFYNENDSVLRPLHRQYIRQCLDALADCSNVVQLISEEYTGPAHFLRFWLETVAEWEAETGRHPMVALSCTKDAQDELLADEALAKVVDIIDIRYRFYNTDSIYAPLAGKNLAPRQHARKMKVGNTFFPETYKSVREYRQAFPDKAVTFFAQDYPKYGWAVLLAGGSCPNIALNPLGEKNAAAATAVKEKFLAAVAQMDYMLGDGYSDVQAIGKSGVGYVIYSHGGGVQSVTIDAGTYRLHTISPTSGNMTSDKKTFVSKGSYVVNAGGENKVFWLERVK